MAEIDWNQFSKRELVEILESFDQQPWVVERLDTDHDCFFQQDCTCDVAKSKLPDRLMQLKQVAGKRGRGDGQESMTAATTEHLRTILTIGYTCLRPDQESALTLQQLRALNLAWFAHKRMDGSVVIVAPSAATQEVAAIISEEVHQSQTISSPSQDRAAGDPIRSPLEKLLSNPPARPGKDRRAAAG